VAGLAWRLPGRRGRAIDPAARLPLVALIGLVVSGLLAAVRPFGEGLFGPFGWPAQACALIALAAALMPVPRWRRADALASASALAPASAPASAGREEDG
jgi:hypothetical protein